MGQGTRPETLHAPVLALKDGVTVKTKLAPVLLLAGALIGGVLCLAQPEVQAPECPDGVCKPKTPPVTPNKPVQPKKPNTPKPDPWKPRVPPAP